jgi:hypothetical protein
VCFGTRAALRRPSAWLLALRREGCFSPAVAGMAAPSPADWNNPANRDPAADGAAIPAAGL